MQPITTFGVRGTMLRVALYIVVASVAVAAAAPPKYKRNPTPGPVFAEAERHWAAAVAEPDATKAMAAWEAAADAFSAIADQSTVAEERKQAAYAALLAWKNALAVEPLRQAKAEAIDYDSRPVARPLPGREQKLLRAFERYLAIDRTSDDEVVGVLFVIANTYRRYDHYDKALPIFLEIIDKHAKHEVAEHAANLALDGYNRLGDYDKLVALARRLRADQGFLANRDDLRVVVERIVGVAARKEAERIEREARASGDREHFDRCGERYLALAQGARATDPDELYYNAGLCFEKGGSMARAVTAFTAISPRSKLEPRALAVLGELYARSARYAEAAAALERYAIQVAGEKDASTAASDAFLFRVTLGDLADAERVLTFAQRTFQRKQADFELARWQLAHRYLEAGKRADARRVVRAAPDPRDDAYRPFAARVLAQAACSTVWIDETCSGASDRTLLERARRIVSAATPSPERQLLELDLEPRADVREAGYRALVAHTVAEVRTAARARLAAVLVATKQREPALAELAVCVRDASQHAQHRALVACERMLGALGAAVERVDEKLPSHRASVVPELAPLR